MKIQRAMQLTGTSYCRKPREIWVQKSSLLEIYGKTAGKCSIFMQTSECFDSFFLRMQQDLQECISYLKNPRGNRRESFNSSGEDAIKNLNSPRMIFSIASATSTFFPFFDQECSTRILKNFQQPQLIMVQYKKHIEATKNPRNSK